MRIFLLVICVLLSLSLFSGAYQSFLQKGPNPPPLFAGIFATLLGVGLLVAASFLVYKIIKTKKIGVDTVDGEERDAFMNSLNPALDYFKGLKKRH